MTVQCPVYKEGLEAVIVPTVKSVQIAIAHYESLGGTASIVVNDDGMQILRQMRRKRDENSTRNTMSAGLQDRNTTRTERA